MKKCVCNHDEVIGTYTYLYFILMVASLARAAVELASHAIRLINQNFCVDKYIFL